MAKKGRQYEAFVYDKMKRLFVDSSVTQNARIPGKQSGLMREIDVSINTDVGGETLLYIVQCKDRGKRPADMVVLGEFSSVVLDVGAAKGFLVCNSGFAKSNHQYALTMGIELVTIEDIHSDRWTAEIQIPLIYIEKRRLYRLHAESIISEELVAMNPEPGQLLGHGPMTLVTENGGTTSCTIQSRIDEWVSKFAAEEHNGATVDLGTPNLRLRMAGVWVECTEFSVTFNVEKIVFLKYVRPDEYSHLRDHVRGHTIPLRMVVSDVSTRLDDSFVEVPGGQVPIFPALSFEIEEWSAMEAPREIGVSVRKLSPSDR